MGGALIVMDIEACYRDMAADQAREQEALEWSEGVIASSCQVPPSASDRNQETQDQLAADEHR